MSSPEVIAEPEQVVAQSNMKPILFFGPLNENCFLGNMYKCIFVEGSSIYNSVEQYFQAKKAALFGDSKRQALIMEGSGPKKQKSPRRKVEGFDVGVWTECEYICWVSSRHTGTNRDF